MVKSGHPKTTISLTNDRASLTNYTAVPNIASQGGAYKLSAPRSRKAIPHVETASRLIPLTWELVDGVRGTLMTPISSQVSGITALG